MSGNPAAATEKTVADPNAEYESLRDIWLKCRAACSGEKFIKSVDGVVDRVNFRNLLIPFSPTMTDTQYRFFKAEAEFPGIVSQFAKTTVGMLLRKPPKIVINNESIPQDALLWIVNKIAQDDSGIVSFLDSALWEELQTSRAWIYVDKPTVTENDLKTLTAEELLSKKPYVILWKAEDIINWKIDSNGNGRNRLTRLIFRSYEERYDKNEFHPELYPTIKVHELDENGFYQIRVFQEEASTNEVKVVSGQRLPSKTQPKLKLVDTITNFVINDKRLDFIPAWPLSGSIQPKEPIFSQLVDKEISLYNKVSRRNHLLYGASTYTPVITSDMPDEAFEEVVSAGLGSWLRLRQGDDAKILDTPTAALQDMDRAIAAGYEEMAKLGIRMLTPEVAQSGVALDIRNASQTAQLGTLNSRISEVLRSIIVFMINWRYGTELQEHEVEFTLSEDFNPMPLGADWLRLATEWYQQGLIPRSTWLTLLRRNDLVASDYDDELGRQEITEDMEMAFNAQNQQYADSLKNPKSE